MTLPIIIGIVVVLALIAIVIPIKFMNMFVQLDKVCEESWSGIDIVLRRRYDLIPNLVSTVKGYMDHEKSVLEQISKLREQGVHSRSVGEALDVEKQLSPALANLFARAEAYPELKASAAFTELQRELVDTEDRVAAARRITTTMCGSSTLQLRCFRARCLPVDGRTSRSLRLMIRWQGVR